MNRYEGKRVLITGGCGFVGINLVDKLLAEGADVSVIDDFSTGDKDAYKFGDGVYVMPVSVTSSVVKDLLRYTDIVFHLAARNIIKSTEDPYEDYETNIGGTLNILMTMREFFVERMVYTSSASVYGNPKYLPINEDDSINLLTPYAVSKYAGEGYCSAFNESYGSPVVVLRLSNVYGPHQSPKNPYCGVVAKFMEKASKGEPIEIHGSGTQTRDFTYVGDVVEALLLAGLSKKAEGEVFNIATGIETSVKRLASSVATVCASHEISKDPFIYIDRRDVDNITRRVLNIEKARRKLGWMPETTLIDGLEITKEWFDNED